MKNQKNMLAVVYLATFFYALHYALTLYIESSFLSKFLSTESIGLIFTVAALISILILFNLSPVLRRFGNYRVMIVAVLFEIVSLVMLALMPSRELVILFFTAHHILLSIIFFSLTVFLEAFSKDETTGGTRGVFLTVLNIAILAGPLIAGSIIENGSYRNAFLISGAIAFPIIFLVARHLKKFIDPQYTSVSLAKTLSLVLGDRNLRHIFIVQFLLEFFYGIMVIYTPIYLNKIVGISMHDILGVIMPIALLPFVIFPYLIGNLADKKFGEKEMLFIGFAIMGLATITLSFINSREVLVWAAILLITRIGATFVETMAESYFFKHIDASSAHIMSFFRNIRSFSYLFSPVIASAFLSIFDYRYIFIALGLVMFLGLRYSILLKDTK